MDIIKARNMLFATIGFLSIYVAFNYLIGNQDISVFGALVGWVTSIFVTKKIYNNE